MALYDYKCPKCKKVVEVLKSMTDNSKEFCPDCKTELIKVLSKFSFRI